MKVRNPPPGDAAVAAYPTKLPPLASGGYHTAAPFEKTTPHTEAKTQYQQKLTDMEHQMKRKELAARKKELDLRFRSQQQTFVPRTFPGEEAVMVTMAPKPPSALKAAVAPRRGKVAAHAPPPQQRLHQPTNLKLPTRPIGGGLLEMRESGTLEDFVEGIRPPQEIPPIFASAFTPPLPSLSNRGGLVEVYDDEFERSLSIRQYPDNTPLSTDDFVTAQEAQEYAALVRETEEMLRSATGLVTPDTVPREMADTSRSWEIMENARIAQELMAEEAAKAEWKRGMAAVRVQSFARAVLSSETSQHIRWLRALRRAAATKIQALVRGHQQRQRYLVKRRLALQKRRYESALAIQCAWRSCVSRAESEARRTVRAEMVQCEREIHRVRALSAVVIQSVWRSYTVRTVNAARAIAATSIQRFYRLFRVYYVIARIVRWRRKKYSFDARRVRAATTIQHALRAHWSRRTSQAEVAQRRLFREEEYRMREAVEDQEEAARVAQKCQSASIIIQRAFMGYLQRQALIQQEWKFHARCKATLSIQCAFRQHLSRIRAIDRSISVRGELYVMKKAEEAHEAAIDLQKFCRRCNARGEVQRRKALHTRKMAAALKIQRVFRGACNRSSVKLRRRLLQEEHATIVVEETRRVAANVIQRSAKRFLVERRYQWQERMRGVRTIMCLRIQHCARYFIARIRMEDARYQRWIEKEKLRDRELRDASARRIQSQSRRRQASALRTTKARERHAKQDGACATIQRAFRAHHARFFCHFVICQNRLHAIVQAEEEALTHYAIVLQRAARMWSAIRRVEALFELRSKQQDAAVRIQSSQRRYRARLEIRQRAALIHEECQASLNRQTQQQSATAIQAVYRGHATRSAQKEEAVIVKAREVSATKLQSWARGNSARSRVSSAQHDRRQSLAEKALLDDVAYDAATAIQKHWRGYEQTKLGSAGRGRRQEFDMVASEEDFGIAVNQAACAIQRTWRACWSKTLRQGRRQVRDHRILGALASEADIAARLIQRQVKIFLRTHPRKLRPSRYVLHRVLIRCYFRESVVRVMQMRNIAASRIQRWKRSGSPNEDSAESRPYTAGSIVGYSMTPPLEDNSEDE